MKLCTKTITLFLSTVIQCTSSSSSNIDSNAAKARASPELERIRLISPEDVGWGHTKIIESLQRKLIKQPPIHRSDYLRHLATVTMEHLCHPSDANCIQRVIHNTDSYNMKYYDAFDHLSGELLPQYMPDFDDEVLVSMEQLFFDLSLIHLKEAPNKVLQIMHEHQEQLRDNPHVKNDSHKLMGLAMYSVGMESAKQWHDIFHQDDSNPFVQLVKARNTEKNNNHHHTRHHHTRHHHTRHHHTRHLQVDNLLGDLPIDLASLVEADVIGASAGAISTAFAIGNGDNVTLMEQMLETSALYSSRYIIDGLTTDTGNGGEDGGGILDGILGIFDGGTGGADTNNTEGNCLFPGTSFCQNGTSSLEGTGAQGILGILGGGGGTEATPTTTTFPNGTTVTTSTTTTGGGTISNLVGSILGGGAGTGTTPTTTTTPGTGTTNGTTGTTTGTNNCLFPNSESCIDGQSSLEGTNLEGILGIFGGGATQQTQVQAPTTTLTTSSSGTSTTTATTANTPATTTTSTVTSTTPDTTTTSTSNTPATTPAATTAATPVTTPATGTGLLSGLLGGGTQQTGSTGTTEALLGLATNVVSNQQTGSTGTTEALLGLANTVVSNQQTTPGGTGAAGTGAAGTGAAATATSLLGALANIPRSAPVNSPKSGIQVGVVGNQTSASNSQDNDDGA